MTIDVPITLIGGRGPHGLAFHLWMRDRGYADADYRLVDPAPHWLPLYGPDGPMQAVEHLRSPRELDFSLGRPERQMTRFVDDDGTRPLANVYSLNDVEQFERNEQTSEAVRAPRLAFWRYANCLAKRSGADERVQQASVTKLEPLAEGDGWRVHVEQGRPFTTRVIVLATGLMPHVQLPRPWRIWWAQLPEASRTHALHCRYAHEQLSGKRVAVLGSSNTASWEAALRARACGARVTLISRALNPIEWQLPFQARWFSAEFMTEFMALSADKRLRILKKTHVPGSALPGTAARAHALGVRVCHFARVRYATPLWNGVQLQYQTTEGEQAEYFDMLIAATGASPRVRELPLVAEAARAYRAPVIVSGPAKHRPILDNCGRWKNLPPLYPMGAHALVRAGLAANTLASAAVYLPLTMPSILRDAECTLASARAA